MTAHGLHPGFHLRSIFLSDLHLGFRGCAAELLTDFLERARIDHLYLLGDILDVSSLRRGFYCNDGDWVESRTVLVEDFDGRLSLLRWPEQRAQLQPALAHAPRLLDAA
jgi:UDP-2,3-diacylglucosamine pyrophosphatase LpxH